MNSSLNNEHQALDLFETVTPKTGLIWWNLGFKVGSVESCESMFVRVQERQLAKESISGLEGAWTPSAHSAHYPASLVFTARGRAPGSSVFTLSGLTHAFMHTHRHPHTNSPTQTKTNT